jgi:hypothetical protein
MNQTLTLEGVQKDFQQWRQNRKKRCSIPDEKKGQKRGQEKRGQVSR